VLLLLFSGISGGVTGWNDTYLQCSTVGASADVLDIVVNGAVTMRFNADGTIDSGMTL
jgi:hypothetical protein